MSERSRRSAENVRVLLAVDDDLLLLDLELISRGGLARNGGAAAGTDVDALATELVDHVLTSLGRGHKGEDASDGLHVCDRRFTGSAETELTRKGLGLALIFVVAHHGIRPSRCCRRVAKLQHHAWYRDRSPAHWHHMFTSGQAWARPGLACANLQAKICKFFM
jgi:hypothetical protein